MAAAVIAAPGTEYGPCDSPCFHEDCAASWAVASSVCAHCSQEVGFGVRYYSHARAAVEGSEEEPTTDYVHAVCEERAVERARLERKALEENDR